MKILGKKYPIPSEFGLFSTKKILFSSKFGGKVPFWEGKVLQREQAGRALDPARAPSLLKNRVPVPDQLGGPRARLPRQGTDVRLYRKSSNICKHGSNIRTLFGTHGNI